MPPKFKFSKNEITKAALDVTKANGITNLTARALAAQLGCSVKPIFGLFQNMEEVRQEVILAANCRYESYLHQDMSSGIYPPYKASGMAYIRFAKEEKELFKLLFMRDRSGEAKKDDEDIKGLIELIKKNVGIGEAEARMFHTEMWFYVHGIATTMATSYLEWNTEIISKVLTDGYSGLKYCYCRKDKEK